MSNKVVSIEKVIVNLIDATVAMEKSRADKIALKRASHDQEFAMVEITALVTVLQAEAAYIKIENSKLLAALKNISELGDDSAMLGKGIAINALRVIEGQIRHA